MFKKAPALTLQQCRQKKARAKHARLAKDARAQFLSALATSMPTAQTEQRALELVERAEAARKAEFLERYRLATSA